MCAEQQAKRQLLASAGDAHSELQISALRLLQTLTREIHKSDIGDSKEGCWLNVLPWVKKLDVCFVRVGKFHSLVSFVNDADFT